MKKSLFYIATAALALVSCNEEELVNAPVSNVHKILTVTFEQDATTRMHIDAANSNALTWSEGDMIIVFDKNDNGYLYTLQEGAGSDKATFVTESVPSEEIIGASFHHDVGHSNNTLGGFQLNCYDLNQKTPGLCDLPMWGKITNDGKIEFKHLAGVLKVNLTNIPAGYKRLIVEASNAIKGNFFTANTSHEYPVLSGSSDSETMKTVNIDFTESTGEANNSSAVLYLPLPVGEYEYINVSVTSGTETKVLKNFSDITIERAKVYSTSVTDYTSVMNEEELVAAVATGGDITLGSDIILTSPIIVESTVVLNLNNKNITTSSEGEEIDAFQVKNNGSLTINGNGTVKATMDCVWAMDDAHVEINGGNFEAGCEAVYAKNNANAVINNGSFKVEGEWGQTYTLNLKDDSRETASITVKGGTFYKFDPANNTAEGEGTNFVAEGYSSVANGEYYEVKEGVYNETALKAAIAAGGDITLGSDIILTSPIIVESTVVLNLNNKNITTTSEGEEIDAFQVKNSGSLTINGDGTVKATMDCVWAMDNAKVEINGGNFEAGCEAVYAKNNAKAVINNGSFKVEGEWDQTYTLNLKDDSRETASITVKGGTFYKFDPANNTAEGEGTNFVAPGYSSVAYGEYYEVKEGVYNETALKAAIAAGGDITLASDIEITSAIQISNTVAINLGEYEIKNATSTSSGKCQVFLIRDGGNLTIDGNGTINAAATCQSVKAVWLYDGGTVNIKGGTFKQAGVESHGSELIYVQEGDLNISGGTFIQSYTVPEISNSYAAVNCLDANYKNGTAKVSITGGTFHKFNPANNVSEGANTNFVADGYVSNTSDNGETYVVTASNEN